MSCIKRNQMLFSALHIIVPQGHFIITHGNSAFVYFKHTLCFTIDALCSFKLPVKIKDRQVAHRADAIQGKNAHTFLTAATAVYVVKVVVKHAVLYG